MNQKISCLSLFGFLFLALFSLLILFQPLPVFAGTPAGCQEDCSASSLRCNGCGCSTNGQCSTGNCVSGTCQTDSSGGDCAGRNDPCGTMGKSCCPGQGLLCTCTSTSGEDGICDGPELCICTEGPPGTPTSLAPNISSPAQSHSSVTLSWSAGTTGQTCGSGSSGTVFKVYLDPAPATNPITLVANNIPVNTTGPTTFTVTSLNPGTTYYWKVVQYDYINDSTTNASNVVRFTTISPPPAAPTPVCNLSSPSSGVADDVCNYASDPTIGFAGPNKNKLSIRDSGPATSSFPHAYQFLLQEVSGSQTTPWVSAGSKTQALINANPIYSFPATTLASNFTSDPRNLVNGNSYQWQAQTIGADGQSSSLSPVWTFVYDNVAPIPQITNFSLKCYTSSTLPPNILVNALDNSEGSGVDRVYVKIYNTTDSLYYSGTQDLSTTAPTPPDTNPYTFNLNQSLMSINKIYEISAKAVDKVSNESAYTPPYKFAYMNRCFDPWIQTSGGDVHANTSFTTSTNTP